MALSYRLLRRPAAPRSEMAGMVHIPSTRLVRFDDYPHQVNERPDEVEQTSEKHGNHLLPF